jgi:hypothetical protein
MFCVLAILMALAQAAAVQPPSDARVLRAIPPVPRGVPFVYEEFRDDILIVKTRVGEAKTGPCVLVPLLGPARVVESHWECAVYYTQVVRAVVPFPVEVQKKRVQVVYIDQAELTK